MLPIEQTSTEAAPGGGDTKVVHAGLDTVPVGLSAVSTRTLSPSIPIGTAGRGTPALWGGWDGSVSWTERQEGPSRPAAKAESDLTEHRGSSAGKAHHALTHLGAAVFWEVS